MILMVWGREDKVKREEVDLIRLDGLEREEGWSVAKWGVTSSRDEVVMVEDNSKVGLPWTEREDEGEGVMAWYHVLTKNHMWTRVEKTLLDHVDLTFSEAHNLSLRTLL